MNHICIHPIHVDLRKRMKNFLRMTIWIARNIYANCSASLSTNALSSGLSSAGRDVPRVYLRVVIINIEHGWKNGVLIRLCSILLLVMIIV